MKSSGSPALAAQLPLIHALRTRLPGTDAEHPARLIETHISWVLLAGGFAYKIKKAVDLGFVDFTTLELRRHYCEEELRLNRRLAPELYLDVMGIGDVENWGQTPILKLGSDPNFEAIEYAVRMLEFPQEALASHALQRGDLRPDHIDALAAQIADFHQHIAVAPLGGDYGSPATVEATMLQNFDVIEPLAEDDAERAEIAALRAWTAAGGKWGQTPISKQRGSAPIFLLVAQRRQSGFVRECHGDLHLGNMVLLDDRLVIFDCIEFNPRLRWIDVISEVAFVVMDLVDRGAPQLAHRFLNAYLERSGDYAGLALLPLYRCYRAMVRAKVARLRIVQMPPGAERDDELLEYRGYLDLARKFTEPPQPLLLITHGLSGSGKSTVTQGLLETMGAVRLRTDVERKRMFAVGVEQERMFGDEAQRELSTALDGAEVARTSGGTYTAESGLYSSDATRQTYEHVAGLARDVLRAGFVCIVDAAFLKRWQRDRFRALAGELNVPFAAVSFTASEATLRVRVAARARKASDVSDADVAILEYQLRTQEPLAAEEHACVVEWDSEANAPDDPKAMAGLVARLS